MEKARQYVYLLWVYSGVDDETNLAGVYEDYEVARRVAMENAKEDCCGNDDDIRMQVFTDSSTGTKRFEVYAKTYVLDGFEERIENGYFVEPRLIRRNEMEED